MPPTLPMNTKSNKRLLKEDSKPQDLSPAILNAHVTRLHRSPPGGLLALWPRLLARWQLCSPPLPRKPNSAPTAREEAINERHAQWMAAACAASWRTSPAQTWNQTGGSLRSFEAPPTYPGLSSPRAYGLSPVPHSRGIHRPPNPTTHIIARVGKMGSPPDNPLRHCCLPWRPDGDSYFLFPTPWPSLQYSV